MALEGSIRDFSLADIFQLIGIQRKTGILTLRHKDEEIKVSFLNGMVVNADSKSGRVDDRLGSVLVKSGKLTQDNLNRALKLQKETLKKLGHVLVENELARPEDLRDALAIQITQIVYRLFRWKDGQYHFEQDVNVDYDKESFSPMSAESILMEGMRMIDEWPIIERKITSYDMVFEQVPLELPVVEDRGEEEEGGSRPGKGDDFDVIFGGETKEKTEAPANVIKLTREESLIYAQVNGQTTVQEVIDRTMLSEFEVCRAFYDLANRNLIVPSAKERKPAAGPRERRSGSSKHLARVAYAAMALWIAAVVVLGIFRRNPLNFLHPQAASSQALAVLTREIAQSRLQRVAAAVDLFVLQHRRPPASLAELVAAGYILDREVRDPWGGSIALEVVPAGVVLRCRTSAASDATVETLELPFP